MPHSEKAQEQIMKAQGYAVEIEKILCDIFKCERFGFGGQINSDAIRMHPFLSMTQGLAFLYAAKESKREKIDNFIDSFSFYSDMSLDQLLSFDTKEQSFGIETIELQKDNGLEEVEYIISAFEETIK